VVDLADDLIIAGVGAAISAAAAIYGARIGARSTREATTRSFNLAAKREDEFWREALRRECEINLTRWADLEPQLLNVHWSFDTGVLVESTLHARAFTPEVFQRIIWVRTNNDQVELALVSAMSGAERSRQRLPELRRQTHAEIQGLFNALNAARIRRRRSH
jgi:hypothetical protein